MLTSLMAKTYGKMLINGKTVFKKMILVILCRFN